MAAGAHPWGTGPAGTRLDDLDCPRRLGGAVRGVDQFHAGTQVAGKARGQRRDQCQQCDEESGHVSRNINPQTAMKIVRKS